MGYVPNHAARSLVTRRTTRSPSSRPTRPAGVRRPVLLGDHPRGSQELMDAGLQTTLLMAQSYPDLDRIERYLRTAPLDVVLRISEHADDDPIPAAMVAAGVPLVIGGRPVQPDVEVPYVDNDNIGGARLADRAPQGPRRSSHRHRAVPPTCRLRPIASRIPSALRRVRPRLVEHGDHADRRRIRDGELLERAPDIDGLLRHPIEAFGALRALRRPATRARRRGRRRLRRHPLAPSSSRGSRRSGSDGAAGARDGASCCCRSRGRS